MIKVWITCEMQCATKTHFHISYNEIVGTDIQYFSKWIVLLKLW